jgi:hypothetical protein
MSGESVLGEEGVVPRTGLELVVTVENDSILPGEPVGAVIILRNSGTEAAPALPYLRPEAGIVMFWIEDPYGTVHQLEPYIHETVAVTPTLLYPGEQLTSRYLLVWEGHGFLFSEVGRHRLVATYVDGADMLVSEAVEVNVLAPAGGEAEAARLILSDPVGRFLKFGGYDPVVESDLSDLLEWYPDSRYAPYAAYALARRCSASILYCAEPGSGELERIPPDYTLATDGFQDVIATWPDSAIADDAQFELARTYGDMGDTAAAGSALAEFFEKYGATSDRLDDAVKLGEEWGWEGVLKEDGATQYAGLRQAAGEATVTWLPKSGTARVTRGRLSVEVVAGRRVAVLGSRRIPLTAAPRVEKGRMLVPASFAELLPQLLVRGRELELIPLPHLAIVSG